MKSVMVSVLMMVVSINAGAHSLVSQTYLVTALSGTPDQTGAITLTTTQTSQGRRFVMKSECRQISGDLIINDSKPNAAQELKVIVTNSQDNCFGQPDDLTNLRTFLRLQSARKVLINGDSMELINASGASLTLKEKMATVAVK